jgi:hypothetical protein
MVFNSGWRFLIYGKIIIKNWIKYTLLYIVLIYIQMSKSYRKSNLYNKTIITKKISIPMRSITTIINKTEDLTKYMEQFIEK